MKNRPINVSVVHFGCAKNMVESERIIALLRSVPGVSVIQDIGRADYIIYNTCSFLESSRKELRDYFFDHKRVFHPRQKHILFGCLPLLIQNSEDSSRYLEELKSLLRKFDIEMIHTLEELGAFFCPSQTIHRSARELQTPGAYAYLKIADGCNNHCSYCLIPTIRGQFYSRPLEEIVEEAQWLIEKKGIREINLVSQDTALYGSDMGSSLSDLLVKLNDIPGDFWIRCLYLHPAHLDEKLLDTMLSLPKVVHYLDIPLQHADNGILQSMNRPDIEKTQQLWKTIREKAPEFMFRTTFMVGYPGETEEAFSRIPAFLKTMTPVFAGFFEFCPEEGTAASLLADSVPGRKVVEKRLQQAHQTNDEQISSFQKKLIGKTMRILVESVEKSQGVSIARAYFQAPEVDSVIILQGIYPVGTFLMAELTGMDGIDLIAKVVE